MEIAAAKAVITGGASGLGLAVAQTVIDTGGQVTLLDINAAAGQAAASGPNRSSASRMTASRSISWPGCCMSAMTGASMRASSACPPN